jgi:hypothetical protein
MGKDASMVSDGPRLRRDLVSTILREDGVKCVDVHDPKRGSSFRLFDYEYSVALAFDGRPLAKVIPWVRLSTGLELTADQLTAFAARLDQLGFLELEGARTPGGAPEKTPAVAKADEEVETASPVPTQSVLAETPVLVPPQPVLAETPVPVPPQSVLAETSVPVPPQPVLAETPVPVPPQPAPAGDETPAPLAAESPPAAAERAVAPAQAEAAPQDTPSPDGLAAAETPAVAVATAQPDRPSQNQPWPLAADATPAPNDLLAPAASTPSPVPLETQPAAVVAQTPTLPSREETPLLMPEPRPESRMSDGEAAEITSQSRAVQIEARMATPGPRRIVTPPPIPAPTPLLTPSLLRPARVRGGPWILYALLGTLTAVVVGVLAVPLALRPHPPAAVRVRVLVAKPMAVLRWFDGSAPVEAQPRQVLSFPAGGKVIRLASPGTALRAGDVVVATDAARWVLADLAKQQERLAYYQQLVKGAQDTGDEKRVAAVRAQVEFRAGLVEQTQQALSHVAVVAQAPGRVEATLATLGQNVQAGVPAVRMQSAGWRASFELPRTLTARVRKQGICGAEIEGRPVGCSLAVGSGDETHVVIDLPPEAAIAAGQMLRLLRARFADAFLLPASALSRVGEGDRILLVAPTGRAEVRSVAVADRTAADVVITQGLDAGDAVIVESSQPVGAGARVRTTHATGE